MVGRMLGVLSRFTVGCLLVAVLCCKGQGTTVKPVAPKDALASQPAPVELNIDVVASEPIQVVYSLESILGLPVRTAALAEALCEPVSSSKGGDSCEEIRRRGGRGLRGLRVNNSSKISSVVPILNPEERLENLAVRSNSLEELESRLEGLITPDEHDDLMEALRGVRALRQQHLGDDRKKRQELVRDQFSTLLAEHRVTDFLARVARFFSLDSPPETVRVALVPVPVGKGSGVTTFAHQAGDAVIVEVLTNDNLEHRLSVVVHELVHVLWFSRSKKATQDLLSQFEALGESEAYLARALLNEALATALGNGLFSSMTTGKVPKEPLYADVYIDAFARSLLTFYRNQFEAGTPPGHGFAKQVTQIFKARFPNGIHDSRLVFRDLALVVPEESPGLNALIVAVRRSLGTIALQVLAPPQSESTRAQVIGAPNRSALIVIPPEQLETISAFFHVDLIRSLVGEVEDVSLPLVISCRHKSGRWYALILANQTKQAFVGVDRLAKTEHMPDCDVIPSLEPGSGR